MVPQGSGAFLRSWRGRIRRDAVVTGGVMPDQQQQDEQGDEQEQSDQSQRTADAGGDDGNDVTKLKAALDKERQRARDLEKEVKPLRTFKSERERTEKERQDAERSEIEKRDALIKERDEQLTAAQARERSYVLRHAIEDAANGEKLVLAVPVSMVVSLIDSDAVEWSDNGTPQNAAALVKALAKTAPRLFDTRRAPIGDGGAGREGGVSDNINDMIRRKVRQG